ncbi:hypothetical protein V1514DRAFT_339317 [Lipomyces japonicus]|uniref:uncharacterized protein n=1 Tax=Lipomyces japonicus TaxID=56871 RepID=UPI0034D00B63
MAVLQEIETTSPEIVTETRARSESPPPPRPRQRQHDDTHTTTVHNNGGNEDDNGKNDQELENNNKPASVQDHDELIRSALALKSSGNQLFNSSDYDGAIAKYSSALATLPEPDVALSLSNDDNQDLNNHRAVLHNNMAACHVKLGQWPAAVDHATAVLQINHHDRNLKALLRRATANEHVGTWTSLQAASEDYQAIVNDCSSAGAADKALARQHVSRMAPLIAQAQKKETAEMVGKLKELGNGLLKPFGLSTDMFNMKPDGKGGYSMSFGQG